jgi:hypothetical protein
MNVATVLLRLLAAAAIVAAIVGQLGLSLSNWSAAGLDTGAQLVNFFSFFTIDANVLSVLVLVIGAIFTARRVPDPAWFAVARGSVVTYMAVTGVVYNLLLRGIELPQGTTLAWSNEVLHVVAPIVLVLDWLLAPGRRELATKRIWIIIAFPLIWTIYTLVRGPHAGWYPYPFLNPATSENGYLSVSFYILLITIIIGLAGAGVIWVSRRRMPVGA